MVILVNKNDKLFSCGQLRSILDLLMRLVKLSTPHSHSSSSSLLSFLWALLGWAVCTEKINKQTFE